MWGSAWGTAGALASEGAVSQMVVLGRRADVGGREGEPLQWLTVEVTDDVCQTSTKQLSGRWLITEFESTAGDAWIHHPESNRTSNFDCDDTPWWVAETAKGRIAVWANPAIGSCGFYVFEDLDDAEQRGIPGDVISAASNALGIQRAEVLDI